MRFLKPLFFSGGFFSGLVVAGEGRFSRNFSKKFVVACKLFCARGRKF